MWGLLEEFGDFARQVFCAIVCFFCIGPILIIIGIVFLVRSGQDPRSTAISKYSGQVNAWAAAGGGFSQFNSTVPNAGYMNVSVVYSWDGIRRTARAYPDYSTTVLTDGTSDYPRYNQYLAYKVGAGAMPVGAQTPSNANPLSMSVSVGVSNSYALPVTTCAVRASAQYSCSNSGRRLMAGNNNCVTYYTDAGTLATASMVAQMPTGCTNAATCSNFRITDTEACGLTYSLSSKGMGSFKSGAAAPAADSNWCNQQFQLRQIPPPTLSLRSATDPYYLLGVASSCTYNFGLTKEQLAKIGVGCLIPGVIITVLIITCIMCLFHRKRQRTVLVQQQGGVAMMPAQPYSEMPPTYASPQSGYQPYPPQGGYVMQQPGYPQQGYPPPQQGYPPPQQGYPPPQQGYLPPQQGYAPPPAGYPSPAYPPPGGYAQPPPVYAAPPPAYY